MENNEIELEQQNVIIKIPVDAVKLTITAKILGDNDTLQTVSADLGLKDIQEARSAFLDNVEFGDDYDAVYVLTEKGRAYLEELERKDDA
jgi:hypothetical protein